MAVDPQFAATQGSEVTAIPATANTARDGSGTLVTILTAGASGTRVERIKIKATGTTTAGMIRIFLHNGTSAFLLDEYTVTAATPSATVKTWEIDQLYADTDPISLPTGWTVKATTHNAEAFHASVIAGDF